MDPKIILEDKDLLEILLHKPTGYSAFGVVEGRTDTIPEEERGDYVEVQIPFCGTYETKPTEQANWDVNEYLLEDGWEHEREALIDSKVFREFLEELDETDIELIRQKKTRLEICYEADLQQCLEDYIVKVQDRIEQASKHKFKKNLVLHAMYSPREYNFTTDTLWAYMHKDDWKSLKVEEVMTTQQYRDWAKVLYTSRDGYIPFYEKNDFFIPEDTIRCSEGVLSYYLREIVADFDDSEEADTINLFDVRWNLYDAFSYYDDLTLYNKPIENCSLYLYRHENPENYDKR